MRAGVQATQQGHTIAALDYLSLLDTAAHISGDAHFGLHLGERVRPGTYHGYGQILLN